MKRSKKSENITKRTVPDEKLIFWREGFLYAMQFLSPSAPKELSIFLENGNTKIGVSNNHYNKVLVWNLPPVLTCPSASLWCTKHCYNADPRSDVFPINKWSENLYLLKNNMEFVRKELKSKINNIDGLVAVRIHSSGDFFSNEYIKMWHEIAIFCPNAHFWAYTRSWNESTLLKELEELQALENIQLFASWDHTMPEPPKEWRQSIVYKPDTVSNHQGLICPEQSGNSPNCISCKFCIRKGKENVLFILH